jgi:integrase
MRKPFYKESHRAWYAEIAGKQVRLAKGDKDDELVKEEAFTAYHRLMAGDVPVTSKTTVRELCVQFTDWVKANKAVRTYDWYRGHLLGIKGDASDCYTFVRHAGSVNVTSLKRHHVATWIEKRGGSDNTKNGAARAVSAMLNWAVERELIAVNPVPKVKRPAATAREVEISDTDWQRVLDATKDEFLDSLMFLDSTGCRPQELKLLTARHLDGRAMILERKNSKGKRVRRVIRLNDTALEIVKRLSEKHTEGPLFRGRGGKILTTSSVAQRFARLREKLKIDGLCCYAVRHRWCQRALRKGLTADTAGVLMGHKDGSMVRKVYGHLEQQHEFLAAELDKATS